MVEEEVGVAEERQEGVEEDDNTLSLFIHSTLIYVLFLFLYTLPCNLQ